MPCELHSSGGSFSSFLYRLKEGSHEVGETERELEAAYLLLAERPPKDEAALASLATFKRTPRKKRRANPESACQRAVSLSAALAFARPVVLGSCSTGSSNCRR